MGDKFSKASAALSLVAVLLIGFVVYRSYFPYSVPSSFDRPGSTVTVDLIGKSVTLPQGQIWGFNPDQQLTVEVVSTKAMDDNTVLIVVDVKSVVKFAPPKEEKKDLAANPNAKKDEGVVPKRATLSGLTKVYYERHKGVWYPTLVDGINLKVEAE